MSDYMFGIDEFEEAICRFGVDAALDYFDVHNFATWDRLREWEASLTKKSSGRDKHGPFYCAACGMLLNNHQCPNPKCISRR